MYGNFHDAGLNVAGLFAPPTSTSGAVTRVPWYYRAVNIPANFRSPYNPNPTLDALKNFVSPVIVIG